MNIKKLVTLISGIFLSIMLASCSGGNSKDVSSEDDSYDINNISVLSVQKASSGTLPAGHEGVIKVTIQSKEEKNAINVPISISFVTTPDVSGDEVADLQQYDSGTYNIPVVTPGISDYELKINIPKIEGSTAGTYKLIAFLYSKLYDSDSESGNLTDDPSDEVDVAENDGTAAGSDVSVDPSNQDEPDVQAKLSTIQDDVFILSTNSLAPADPANLAVQIKVAAMAVSVTDAKVKFYISHLDGSQRYQIQIKNSDASVVYEKNIESLSAYQEKDLAYELVIPSSVITSLVQYAKEGTESRYPFMLEAVLTSDSEKAEYKENNSVISNFWLVPDESLLPNICDYRRIGFNFSRYSGNSHMGAGFNISSYTGIDQLKVYNEEDFSIPMKVSKFSFKFIEAALDIRGYFKGQGENPGVNLGVKAFGYTIYHYNNPAYYAWSTPGMKDGKVILENLSYAPVDGNKTIDFNPFEGDKAPEKPTGKIQSVIYYEQGYSGQVMAGPIPVTYTVGVFGYAGIGAFAVYEQVNIAAGFVPYCGIGVYASVGVGIKGILEAGVAGRVNAAEILMKNLAWTSWEDVKKEDNKLYKQVSLNEYSGLELNMLRGVIYAYAKYPWPKFKKTKFGTFFVGFYTKESRFYIWDHNSSWVFTQQYPIIPKNDFSILIPLE